MHSSRMRTSRLLTISYSAGGICLNAPDADPGHVTCDACWEANPSPVDRMTHGCENITLP